MKVTIITTILLFFSSYIKAQIEVKVNENFFVSKQNERILEDSFIEMNNEFFAVSVLIKPLYDDEFTCYKFDTELNLVVAKKIEEEKDGSELRLLRMFKLNEMIYGFFAMIDKKKRIVKYYTKKLDTENLNFTDSKFVGEVNTNKEKISLLAAREVLLSYSPDFTRVSIYPRLLLKSTYPSVEKCFVFNQNVENLKEIPFADLDIKSDNSYLEPEQIEIDNQGRLTVLVAEYTKGKLSATYLRQKEGFTFKRGLIKVNREYNLAIYDSDKLVYKKIPINYRRSFDARILMDDSGVYVASISKFNKDMSIDKNLSFYNYHKEEFEVISTSSFTNKFIKEDRDLPGLNPVVLSSIVIDQVIRTNNGILITYNDFMPYTAGSDNFNRIFQTFVEHLELEGDSSYVIKLQRRTTFPSNYVGVNNIRIKQNEILLRTNINSLDIKNIKELCKCDGNNIHTVGAEFSINLDDYKVKRSLLHTEGKLLYKFNDGAFKPTILYDLTPISSKYNNEYYMFSDPRTFSKFHFSFAKILE